MFTSGGTLLVCRSEYDHLQGSYSYSISCSYIICRLVTFTTKFPSKLSWFKNAESRLNHHLSGLFGVSSLAWTGHLVHVAIPESRGQHVRWDNFLSTLPHPAGLGPFFSGNWAVYAQNPDTAGHIFGTSEGAGTAILTFLRWIPPTNTKFMA